MLEILQAGLLATIQDLGRTGFRASGINPGGAMDPFAVRAANALLGNDRGAAVIEMHWPAPRFRFNKPALLALAGADFKAILETESGSKQLDPWRPYIARVGDQLHFDKNLRPAEARCYLALRGGFEVPLWLGSRSTHAVARMGGFEGRALKKGDLVPYSACAMAGAPPWSVSPLLWRQVYSRTFVSVIPGPEWGWLTESAQAAFEVQAFTVTPDSNRTGYRLQGTPLEKSNQRELLSSGTAMGTLQLLPSGQMILLMADHPVTGGYPRIAVAATADLPYLAQQPVGAELRFARTTAEEARGQLRELEHQMQQFGGACSRRIEEWLAR